jgi:uncharacterized protein with PIN domain
VNITAINRKQHLEHCYGISVADFEQRLLRQNGKCAICKEDITETKNGRLKAHIDHDHETGVVRGLLCLSCNTGLGQFKDSPINLRAAAQYLTNAKLA